MLASIGWVIVWSPITKPPSASARKPTRPAPDCAERPSTKNVAGAWKRRRIDTIRGVSGPGPSSKVRATSLTLLPPLVIAGR